MLRALGSADRDEKGTVHKFSAGYRYKLENSLEEAERIYRR
jgi:hypothetical protein